MSKAALEEERQRRLRGGESYESSDDGREGQNLISANSANSGPPAAAYAQGGSNDGGGEDAVAAKRREALAPTAPLPNRSSTLGNNNVPLPPPAQRFSSAPVPPTPPSPTNNEASEHGGREEEEEEEEKPAEERQPESLPTARRIYRGLETQDYDDEVDEDTILEGVVEAREVNDLGSAFRRHGYAVAEAVRPEDEDYYYYDDEQDFDFEKYKEDVRAKEEVENRSRRKTYCIVLVITLFLVVAAALAGALGRNSQGKTIVVASAAPTMSMSPSMSPSAFTKEVAIRRLLVNITDAEVLDQTPRSPQGRALEWLAYDDDFDVDWEDTANPTVERIIRERYILASFYYATGGDNWKEKLDSYLSAEDVCLWNDDGKLEENGVFCNEDGTLVVVRFEGNNLDGTIPSELGHLRTLAAILLSNNNLYGTLPREFGGLSGLTLFQLSNNRLRGTLFPMGPKGFPDLRIFMVDGNQMSGVIPPYLWHLETIEKFRAESNNFVGTFGPIKNCPPPQTGLEISMDCFTSDSMAEPEVKCLCCTTCCEDSDDGSPICFLPEQDGG